MMKLKIDSSLKIGIVGLGYVGLPLALAFSTHFEVYAFDKDALRIDELNRGIDITLQSGALLENLTNAGSPTLRFFNSIAGLACCDVYIVAVPTPIDEFKEPNLNPLKDASKSIAGVLKKGAVVIYESTVYPGCTEEVCVPILESVSGLKFNEDFFVGYSPERINPGDQVNTLAQIVKVTAGSEPDTAQFVDQLYKKIITAGTYLAPSIKVAEAAKAIENAQRDVNISFVNELALIFDRLGIDTQEVLEAAATKWNFLKYKPGLVGGHCIGVDPYYLAHKAKAVGYHPDVILSGRRVNDQMGTFVAQKIIKLMIQKNLPVNGARVLILGITFKENCPDIRNTKVVDIYQELMTYKVRVDIYDPLAVAGQVQQEYGIKLMDALQDTEAYSAIVLAVAHQEFLGLDLKQYLIPKGVIFDTKGILDKAIVDGRL